MYTFALLKPPLTPLLLPMGLKGVVQLVQTATLAAVVEPDVTITVLQTDDAMLMQSVLVHDRVMRELFTQTTILPLRFGTCFDAVPSLLHYLEANQQQYLDTLNQLEGQAEYMLTLTPKPLPEVTLAPELKGKEYFLAKKQQYQAQLAYQQQQQQELANLKDAIAQSDTQTLIGQAIEQSERIYLLAARQQEANLMQQIDRWQDNCPLWEIVCGEALPPYHFLPGT